MRGIANGWRFWFRPCWASLLLCIVGMVGGLSLDALDGKMAMLDALCLNGPRNPLWLMVLHWQQLPAMHVGMLLGGRGVLRCAFMFGGMELGALAHFAAGGTGSVVAMLTMMIVGMALGNILGGAIRAGLSCPRVLRCARKVHTDGFRVFDAGSQRGGSECSRGSDQRF